MSRIRSLRAWAARIGGRLRALGVGAQLLELPCARLELRARRLQLGERALMLGDALAIEVGERGDRARGLGDAPQIRGREQQPQIAALSELVDLDEARAEAGPLGEVPLFELPRAVGGVGKIGGRLLRLGIDPAELLGFHLPLDLELPQIAEQRLLLRRELVGFALQRLEALGRPPRERLGARAVGLLREKRIRK